MNFWHIGWLLIGLAAGGLEVAGLLTKSRGDTLSEIVWKLRLPARVAIAVGLGWLGYHFVWMRWLG